jgi:hypothetical protein
MIQMLVLLVVFQDKMLSRSTKRIRKAGLSAIDAGSTRLFGIMEDKSRSTKAMLQFLKMNGENILKSIRNNLL